MKISRQVGTVSEILQIFVQDATVSTGAGFPNLQASSFSSYWCRNDQTSTSSVTLLSSAASSLGLYASGKWLQVNSTFMQGWYQLSVPNGVFASSRSAAIHLYGHPSMAPVPIEIELTRTDNQTYVSSQPFNISTVQGALIAIAAPGIFSVGRVGVSSFNSAVGVSSFDVGLQVGVSSFNSRVGVSSFDLPVGVSSMAIGVGVTTFNSRVGVSSFNLPVGVSSFDVGLQVGVSSFDIRVGVSSFGLPVGVSSLTPGVNVTSVTGLTVIGTGTSSDPWGPA